MKSLRSIQDDRNHTVRLVHPGLHLQILSAPRDAARRLRAARRVYSRSGDLIRGVLSALLTTIGIGLLATGLAGSTAEVADVSRYAFMPLLMAAWIFFGDFLYDKHDMLEAMKAQKLCPACADDLMATRADEDGCHICRNCNAAWRLDPDSSRTMNLRSSSR